MPNESTEIRALRIAKAILSQVDFNSIKGIDSETDHLPIGRVREEWHPKYLLEKDREIARCEDLYRDKVRAICEGILQRAQRVQ